MKSFSLLCAVVSLTLAAGCHQDSRPAVDPVPPPAPGAQTQDNTVLYPDPPAGAIEPTPVIAEPVVIDPAGSTDQAPGTYTVAKGDTLWSIANRYYGDGQRWKDIVSANPGLSPEKLAVGQTLTMPQ